MRMILVLKLTVLLIGCKQSPTRQMRIHAEQGRMLANFAERVTSGARTPDGRFAAGTADGKVVVDLDGELHALLSDQAPSSKASSQPAVVPPRHDGAINALDFADDGKTLLSIGGRTAIAWDLGRKQMLRQLRGPQQLTAGRFSDDSHAVFFATEEGHVLRWKLDKRAADAVARFRCGATPVLPERQKLSPEKRCVGGTAHFDGKQQYCSYAVTHLRRYRGQIARACREGSIGIMNLKTRRIRWCNVGGVLSDFAFVGERYLLLASRSGRLQLWDLEEQKITRRYRQVRGVDAVAATAETFVVAAGKQLLFFARDQLEPAGALRVPQRVVWLALDDKPLRVTALFSDGRMVGHNLRIAAAQ